MANNYMGAGDRATQEQLPRFRNIAIEIVRSRCLPTNCQSCLKAPAKAVIPSTISFHKLCGYEYMGRLEMTKRLAGVLEKTAIGFALWSLFYRATLYWKLPAEPGQNYGLGDLLDLLFALLLFLICLFCAGTGVAISILGEKDDKPLAYKAFFIGLLSFLSYDLLHPYIPRLI